MAPTPSPDDDPELPPEEDPRVRFPFGETVSSDEGAPLFDESAEGSSDALFASSAEESGAPFDESLDEPPDDLSEEVDSLSDSDLEVFEGSGSSVDPHPLGSSIEDLLPGPSRRRSKLPNVPPDAELSDDASLEMLGANLDESADEEYVDLDVSDELPPTGVTDLGRISDLGPISPSGPLVIVDDDDANSTRFQASIVDDSARLAGSRASRRRKPKRKAQRSTRERWTPDDSGDDADVPTLSTRLPREEEEEEEERRNWAPLFFGLWLVTLIALIFVVWRGRDELAALEARLRDENTQALEALRGEQDAQLASVKQSAQDEFKGALERARSEARSAAEAKAQGLIDSARASARAAGEEAGRKAAEDDARARMDRAVADAVKAEREKARRERRAAIDVELARAKGETADEAARALAEAVAAARQKSEREKASALQDAEDRHREDLEKLRKELSAELSGSSRKEEAELAKAIERDRKEALDAQEGKSSGGDEADSVDDWEKEFFDDDSSSSDSGGDGGGESGGDDFDALFADEGEGASDDSDSGGDDEENAHFVDRAWSWAKENIHGSVGYKNLSHFSRGPRRDLRKTRHEFKASLDYKGWLWQNDSGSTGVRLVAEFDVKADDDNYATGVPDSVDDDDRRRPILTTRDLYGAVAVDWLELRAGYQIFGWGTGDLINPTNNINPIDYSDPFDSRRIPVLATTISLDFDTIAFEFVSIPTFTRSRLPLKNRRFDVLRESPLPVLNPQDPETEPSDAQWAARFSAHVGGFDLSLSGFTGFSDLPSARIVLIQQPQTALVVDPVFERVHIVGFDFATTLGILGAEGKLGDVLGGIQLHGEAAHVFTEGRRADDYLQFVIGLNYQFVDLIFEHDLQIVLEFGTDYVTSDAEGNLETGNELDRVFRNAVLFRLDYAISESIGIDLTGGLILYGTDNGFFHPAAHWNVTDNLRLEISGDIFVGGDETFFGQLKRDGRAIFEAKWRF